MQHHIEDICKGDNGHMSLVLTEHIIFHRVSKEDCNMVSMSARRATEFRFGVAAEMKSLKYAETFIHSSSILFGNSYDLSRSQTFSAVYQEIRTRFQS